MATSCRAQKGPITADLTFVSSFDKRPASELPAIFVKDLKKDKLVPWAKGELEALPTPLYTLPDDVYSVTVSAAVQTRKPHNYKTALHLIDVNANTNQGGLFQPRRTVRYAKGALFAAYRGGWLEIFPLWRCQAWLEAVNPRRPPLPPREQPASAPAGGAPSLGGAGGAA